MIGLRKIALLLATGLALLAPCLTPDLARAEYPERQITMIVCFGAGGGTDIAARLIADPLSKALGKAVVVENRPGAGGNLGRYWLGAAGRRSRDWSCDRSKLK